MVMTKNIEHRKFEDSKVREFEGSNCRTIEQSSLRLCAFA